jgi:photosystem II stability/assembly factor-like uncharacterized protein
LTRRGRADSVNESRYFAYNQAKGTILEGVVLLDRQRGWAVGEYGTVLRTQDGGTAWIQMRNVPTPTWLRGVRFIDERHGWAVGSYETVLKTENGGKSWAHQKIPTPRRLFGLPMAYESVRFGDAEGWIVGQYGNIPRTVSVTSLAP